MFRLFLEFSGELFHRNVNGISVEFAVPNQMMLRFLRISRVFQRNERYWRSSQGLEAACDFPVCKRCFIKLCVRKQRLLIGDGFFFVEFLRGGGGYRWKYREAGGMEEENTMCWNFCRTSVQQSSIVYSALS